MKIFSNELTREGIIYGEEVYSNRTVAPKWYWLFRAAVMFFGIVWRVFDVYVEENGRERNIRLSAGTSLSITWIVFGEDIKNSHWLFV